MIAMPLIFNIVYLLRLAMFHNLQCKNYTVKSNTHAPLCAPNISVPQLIQSHKNIFMRASGHWATAMFAIFSALYDSIQASRLILRAPSVSPSIRNMYNSTTCFFTFFSFLFFLNKHTLLLLPGLSNDAIWGKKRIVRLGDRVEGSWRNLLVLGDCKHMFLTQRH